jgi:plastocyanin
MARRISIPGMAALAIAALFALTTLAAAAPRTAETKTVDISNFAFNPATIEIMVGDTVRWVNNDTAPHTATAGNGGFDSGNLSNGQEYSFTFTEAGSYNYVCRYHDVMAATVVVAAAAAPAPAPAAPAPAPAAQPAPTGSVEASDQPIVNGAITVAKVTSSVDGWIVVHLDEGGRPGKVLGQSAVRAGDNTNVVVQLSEDVPVGGMLWPMLHVDAGAAGTYEFPGADVPVRVNDMVVMVQISVTEGAAAAPSALPRTAGDERPAWLLLAAITAAAGGALLVRRVVIRR